MRSSEDSEKRRRKRRGEREDGRILVTLIVGFAENGKPIRKYFYGRSRAEAERKRDEYRRFREMGIFAGSETMTLNDWIDEWYARYKSNGNSDYEANNNVPINRLRNALGDRLLRSIVEADLQDTLFDVADMSGSTIKKYHSVIRQVFSKAKRNKLLVDDPSEDLIVPHGYDGTHRALEPWESEAILKHWSVHRAGLWAMLMLLCGLRRSEMIALDWANVDMDKRQVYIKEASVILKNKSVVRDRTKSAAGVRVLPICDQLYTALDSVPEKNRSGPVCLSANGMRITGSAYDRGWDGFNLAIQRVLNGEDVDQRGRHLSVADRIAAAEREGRTYVRFHVLAHDLRHTFATALYDAGVSIKAAQYYLGHSDIKITLNLYTHLSKERENAERSQLTGFLDEWFKSLKIGPES